MIHLLVFSALPSKSGTSSLKSSEMIRKLPFWSPKRPFISMLVTTAGSLQLRAGDAHIAFRMECLLLDLSAWFKYSYFTRRKKLLTSKSGSVFFFFFNGPFGTLQRPWPSGPPPSSCQLVLFPPSLFFFFFFFFFLAASCEMQRVTPAHPRNHLSDSSSPEAINPLGAFLTFQVSTAAGLPPHNPVLFL